MNTILERDIDAFIAGNREKILSDIGELVAVPSVEGAPAEGAPFGPGPREGMDKALEIALHLVELYRDF